MAKVRVRQDNKLLFMDFYYRGIRCREQTALPDNASNRRRVQILLNRIDREIKQGLFDYTATFPDSPRAAQFATPVNPLTEARQAAVAAIPPAPAVQGPIFSKFANVWRAEMAPQWRRLHRLSVDTIFESHLLPAFGDRPIASISKADILAFRAKLAALPGRTGKRLAASTVNKIFGLLRQCLMEAEDRYGLPDVFRGIRRLKARRPDVHPFSLEEMERIRATIRPDFRDYVTVRFFTGMRSGEINGLKWKCVDFDAGLILVRETFSAGKVEADAKTELSLRDIPMLPMVREALQHQRENRHPDSDYVFCSREGNPIDANNFANRIWYPLLRYLQLEKRRPYQTRHTTATLMLASGENPEWIAHLMGHANTQMLFTVYSRFVPNLTHRDGLAITGLLSRQRGIAEKLDTDGSTADSTEAGTDTGPVDPVLTRKQLESMSARELRQKLAKLLINPSTPVRRLARQENTHA